MSERNARRAALARAGQPWRWLPFGLRLRVARLRALLGRRRVVRRLLLVATVGFGLWAVAALASGAQLERERWGNTTLVAVAKQELAVGDTLSERVIEFVEMPIAAVPTDALHDRESLAAPVAVPLLTGDVVRERDLQAGSSNVIPAGHRALSVPRGPHVPELAVGDHVDVFVFDDAFGGVSASQNHTIAGRTIEVGEEALTIAVPARDASILAAGVASGSVVLAAS